MIDKKLLERGASHYKGLAIEPIEFIVANKMSFLVGGIIKYVCRYDRVDRDKAREDLGKAQHLLEILISSL